MGFIVHECDNQLEHEGSNWLSHECTIQSHTALGGWFNRLVALRLPVHVQLTISGFLGACSWSPQGNN